MKKVVIVGGGMAGLCAGIYSCLSGYETVVYEKNSVPGGNCSGWNRNGYSIDNCIHWMTGTRTGTPQNELWREVGALSDEVRIIKRDELYSSELNGKKITLWRDLDRTEKEMLELSPEDEKEIKHFIECTRLAIKLEEPVEKPKEMINVLKEAEFEVSRRELLKTMVMYAGLSAESLAKKFKHPLLQKVMTDFMAKEYEAYWLVLAYSFFITGNGDLPEGGSMGVVRRIENKYRELGGELHLSTPVRNINIVKTNKKERKLPKMPKIPVQIPDVIPDKVEEVIQNKIEEIAKHHVDGIYLTDGTFVEADYVICACDINYAFSTLLKKKYAPKAVKKAYKDKDNNPVYSSFQTAFSVDGTFDEVPDTLSFECNPIDVGRHLIDRICVKNYRLYGDYIAPEGKTVIQCSIVQYKEDYKYWCEIDKNHERYNQLKHDTAQKILNRIETKYPKYKGKIHLIDVWTPLTYAKRNNCYNGAYMRFITTATNVNAFISNEIKDLDNIYLASQWLRYPGGIPMAALMGKEAVKKINKKEKRE